MNDHAPDRSPPTGKRSLTRRRVLGRVAGLGLGATLANTALGAFPSHVVAQPHPGGTPMVSNAMPVAGNSGYVTTQDGTRIFSKDWGAGQPVVFRHGWPLNGDAWDGQSFFVASNGYRAIAHGRRGHGRSSQPWSGNDMDTYADDLATLIDTRDLRDVVLVGHSTGGGEVTRYVGRHGTARVAKVVLVGAVPPLMLKTAANPEGTPIETFDAIRAGVASDRSQYYKDLSVPFYGANRPHATVSQGVLDMFWRWSMQVGLKGAYDCIKVFSETDMTDDLQRIDVPTLIIHGDDDQIVPIADSAEKAVTLVPDATLTVYPGAPHGFPMLPAYENEFNADLLAFLTA
jgi:non-heme chloroperoxidase